MHAHIAQQGRRYAYGATSVLAMQTGTVVQVREINPAEAWLGPPMTVKASWLQPQPMRYFHGATPECCPPTAPPAQPRRDIQPAAHQQLPIQ